MIIVRVSSTASRELCLDPIFCQMEWKEKIIHNAMRNKWFKNLPQMCQFLSKWRSEGAEAHPSQTSQESLKREFHFCLHTPFSPSVAFSFSPISSQLVICSLMPPCSPSGRCIIIIPLLLLSHPFSKPTVGKQCCPTIRTGQICAYVRYTFECQVQSHTPRCPHFFSLGATFNMTKSTWSTYQPCPIGVASARGGGVLVDYERRKPRSGG